MCDVYERIQELVQLRSYFEPWFSADETFGARLERDERGVGCVDSFESPSDARRACKLIV